MDIVHPVKLDGIDLPVLISAFLCPSQADFHPAHNANLNIIDKYNQLKQPLLCCFIDLHKASSCMMLGCVGVACMLWLPFTTMCLAASNFIIGYLVVLLVFAKQSIHFGVFIKELHDTVVAESPAVRH
jgi:hypothetical protein